MMTKVWDELLRRVQSWPEDAQEELAQVASEIQTELNGSKYQATVDALADLDDILAYTAENYPAFFSTG